MTLPPVAILGAGRAGCSIYRALGSTEKLLWTRSPATARESGLPALLGPELPDLSATRLVLLAVSDAAVGPLAATLADAVPSNAIVAHLAGALDLDVLAPISSRGVAVGSMHPLVSIATRETTFTDAAAAVVATTPAAEQVLTNLAETLGLFPIRPVGDRARYHAAASIVGNFPAALLESAVELFASLGLSREESIRALGPLLVGAARNATELGPVRGLTGPIVRGDIDVIRRHLAAIGDSPDSDVLYRAAGRVAADLASQRGTDTTAIKTLLDSSP